MKIIYLLFLSVLLSACIGPQDRVTDAQVKEVARLCESKGMIIRVYNTDAVSRVDCVK